MPRRSSQGPRRGICCPGVVRMENKLPVYFQGMEWGILRWEDQEVRAVFTLRCTSPGPGLYKAYLVGSAGAMLLGTPMPEGTSLVLRRVITHDALRGCRVLPPIRGELRSADSGAPSLCPPGWREGRRADWAAADPVIRDGLDRTETVWVRAEADGLTLLLPWETGRELPLTAAVCFLRVQKLDGITCIKLELDRRGRPVGKGGGDEN